MGTHAIKDGDAAQTARNHIRIIDEIPEILFGKLQDGDALAFKAIDPPEQDPEDERRPEFLRRLERMKSDQDYRQSMASLGRRPRKTRVRQLERELKNRVRAALGMEPWRCPIGSEEQAARLGIDTNYDLPTDSGPSKRRHQDGQIQTLHYPDVLEAKLNAVRDAARTMAEDAGIAALYCAFGFLEWYESQDSSEAHYAPLVLFPVDIERRLENGVYHFDLKGRDEDPL